MAQIFAEFLSEINELTGNIVHMKQPEYTEGPEALQNFKRLATAILQAPVKKKKRQAKKSGSLRKQKKSDGD
jgi:hypothetical protein